MEANAFALADLRRRVEDKCGGGNAQRWKAGQKDAIELLLALVLGIEEQTAATKSQWLKCLRSAQKLGVEACGSAFVEWIVQVGGVKAAGNIVASNTRSNGHGAAENWTGRLDEWLNEGPAIPIPQLTATEAPDPDYVVVLCKRTSEGQGMPIASIAHQKLVQAFAQELFREERDAHRSMLRHEKDFEREVRRALMTARSRWRRRCREQSTYPLTFNEWVGENYSDGIFPDTPRMKAMTAEDWQDYVHKLGLEAEPPRRSSNRVGRLR